MSLEKRKHDEIDDDEVSYTDDNCLETDENDTTDKLATSHEFYTADVTVGLANLSQMSQDKNRKVRLIVTSPPYYGARDYSEGTQNKLGTHNSSKSEEKSTSESAQLGHEISPFAYVRRLAKTFVNCKRFLTNDASIFIVIGDTFARKNYTDEKGKHQPIQKGESIGIFGLLISEMRALGFMLWQEIVWNKPSVPPSGAAQIRCNPCSERVLWFVITKPYFNNKAIRETGKTPAGKVMPPVGGKKYADGKEKTLVSDGKRCRQDVWTICPSRDRSSHVAPFPEELVAIPIKGCTERGDTIIDPFAGTLTTRKVAEKLSRHSICFDLFDHTNRLKRTVE